MKYYILEGKTPVQVSDVLTWAKMFEDTDRHVADDYVGSVRVSTVFLGMDHSWNPSGPPMIFETLIFGGELDGEMDRYSTWEEAEFGHKKMLEEVKQLMKDELHAT